MIINKGKRILPRRVLLYGTKGIGKSTWARDAGALFLNVEDGLNDIECDSTEWLRNYAGVVGAISWLIANPVPNPAIAIDSADWLQAILFDEVASEKKKDTIEDIGYGKGFLAAAKKLEYVIQGLDHLRITQGKHIIFLAHEKIYRFNKPGGDSYDRYAPDLHKDIESVLSEWCDEVLFASYRVVTKEEDMGFNKVRKVAIGGQERFVRTTETAAVTAKNRLQLPDELPMSWEAYARHFPRVAPKPEPVVPRNGHDLSGGDIAGLVVDGSSKVTV